VKALALHFPRERNGRFLRAAVCGLPWLRSTVRRRTCAAAG
jgi:hypothetical protein